MYRMYALALVVIIALGAAFVWQSAPDASENTPVIESKVVTPLETQSATERPQPPRHETESATANNAAPSATVPQSTPEPPSQSQAACPEPFIFDLPIDISKATSILYPGQVRGGDFKAHGGFRFDTSKPEDITVVAPYEAHLIAGARYPVEGGAIQYAFDFEHPCGIRYRFMHLLTLTPKFQAIAETFPLPPTTDSRTTFLRTPIEIKRGEVISTAVGVPYGGPTGPNTFVDWGVYDYRVLNESSKDPAWAASHQSDTYQHGVCWFSWISAENRAKVLALPPGDGQSGASSDFCK